MALYSGRKKGFRLGGLFCFYTISFLLFPYSAAARSAPPIDTLPQDTLEQEAAGPAEEEPEVFTVIGVGDMMLGTNYPSPVYLPPLEGATMLAQVWELLADADVTFGNLEGTILDEGGTAKRCNNPDACYVFRSPESYVRHFVQAGFDFLSIANNHSGDFGRTGRERTKAVLDEAGIAYAGIAGTDEYAIIERNGLAFGMAAFSPNWGTCSIHDYGKARAIVSRLDEVCDVVIVSFHGGAEGKDHQHVPRKPETYYGENRGDVYKFSHAMVDAGADIIFGHGPHVTRGMELYNDRLICYSLGNFCTYGRFNLRGEAGVAPMVKVEVDKKGRFQGGFVTSIYQRKAHGPREDLRKRALKTLIRLTKSDFPETPLLIEADGRLRKRAE
ncbi:MAG: CapA family protein [Bacteroidetes bacterium]|jgi:poly-gamma-glutamate capsule biosynthesis protein CapA/YwtB (metallophosphatase superfamily)|nr:CapA family protein [Bacteroidota bacterium]